MTISAWIAAHPGHMLMRIVWRRGWTWVLVPERGSGKWVVWNE